VGHATNAAGQFIPADWWAIIFNPSFPYRFVHVVIAAYLTTAMIVGAVGAWHVLKNGANERARIMFSMAMWMAAAVAPAQAVCGDMQGLWALHYHPQKVAAMEGHWETQRGAPLILFGMPDMEREETRLSLEVPRLGSLILRHDWDGEIQGLKDFPKDQRPTNVPLVFWSFRIMVALGLLFIFMFAFAFWVSATQRFERYHWFLRLCFYALPLPWNSTELGWVVAEVGRQPWVIEGMLPTQLAASSISAGQVLGSLAGFVLFYSVLAVVDVFLMRRYVLMGPDEVLAKKVVAPEERRALRAQEA